MAKDAKVSGTPEPGSPPAEIVESGQTPKEISALEKLRKTPIPKGTLAGVYNALNKLPGKDQM